MQYWVAKRWFPALIRLFLFLSLLIYLIIPRNSFELDEPQTVLCSTNTFGFVIRSAVWAPSDLSHLQQKGTVSFFSGKKDNTYILLSLDWIHSLPFPPCLSEIAHHYHTPNGTMTPSPLELTNVHTLWSLPRVITSQKLLCRQRHFSLSVYISSIPVGILFA